MKKKEFYKQLSEILDIEDTGLNEDSAIVMTSMAVLGIIALADENFGKQVKISDLKQLTSVHELMELIGIENFE